jgi:hypothetical protein
MGVDILFFGDQSDIEIFPFIRRFILRREHSILVEAFLVNISSVLRESIAALPASQRELIPSFVNLSDFIDSYQFSAGRNPIVDNALLCVAQLAHYIR